MTSRSPARSSQPGPSTSNVIDSVMENEQLSSTQVGLNRLICTMHYSKFILSNQKEESISVQRVKV